MSSSSFARTIPKDWSDIRLSPLGLFTLRERFGFEKGRAQIFGERRHNFKASELAWLVAGLHKDGKHLLQSGALFHEEYVIARSFNAGAHDWKIGKAFRETFFGLIFDLVRFSLLKFPLILIACNIANGAISRLQLLANAHDSRGC